MRALAIGTAVVTAALFAGCDSGPGGSGDGPLPVPTGERRGPEVPDDDLRPTAEALEACGWTAPQPPTAGSEDARALERCLRALRGYPDPVRSPVELVRAELFAFG